VSPYFIYTYTYICTENCMLNILNIEEGGGGGKKISLQSRSNDMHEDVQWFQYFEIYLAYTAIEYFIVTHMSLIHMKWARLNSRWAHIQLLLHCLMSFGMLHTYWKYSVFTANKIQWIRGQQQISPDICIVVYILYV
jgi:hypothetical protein